MGMLMALVADLEPSHHPRQQFLRLRHRFLRLHHQFLRLRRQPHRQLHRLEQS